MSITSAAEWAARTTATIPADISVMYDIRAMYVPGIDTFGYADWSSLPGVDTSGYLRPTAGDGLPYFYNLSVLEYGARVIKRGEERFVTVSSLYGPGNMACWILLLLSVLVSWTLNPRSARRDTLSNDMIAALAMPCVAVGDFFYRIHAAVQTDGVVNLLSVPEWNNVQSVAALEASVAVCEDFLVLGVQLLFVAARNGHKLRLTLITLVMSACLATQLFLMSLNVPFEKSLLVRPFLFHSAPVFASLLAWMGFAVALYVAETVLFVVRRCSSKSVDDEGHGGEDQEEHNTERSSENKREWLPGQVSSWMAAISGIAAVCSVIWIKYKWIYPMGWSKSVRFVAKTSVELSELDQIVTLVGGLITLSFSLRDAVKERYRKSLR